MRQPGDLHFSTGRRRYGAFSAPCKRSLGHSTHWKCPSCGHRPTFSPNLEKILRKFGDHRRSGGTRRARRASLVATDLQLLQLVANGLEGDLSEGAEDGEHIACERASASASPVKDTPHAEHRVVHEGAAVVSAGGRCQLQLVVEAKFGLLLDGGYCSVDVALERRPTVDRAFKIERVQQSQRREIGVLLPSTKLLSTITTSAPGRNLACNVSRKPAEDEQ